MSKPFTVTRWEKFQTEWRADTRKRHNKKFYKDGFSILYGIAQDLAEDYEGFAWEELNGYHSNDDSDW